MREQSLRLDGREIALMQSEELESERISVYEEEGIRQGVIELFAM